MTRYFFFLIFLTIIESPLLWSQDLEAPIDSALTMQVEEPNKFSFIFQRSLMIQSNQDESAPISSISGAWYAGLGFKFPFAKNKLGFRVQPGLTWVKLNYDENDPLKTFPDTLSHNTQKHRLTYFEVPIGLYYNITLDKERNAKVFFEGGGFIGYNTGAIHKYIDNNVLDQPVKTKISAIQDIEPLRYGVYGRFGYKFFALTYFYRMTDLFTQNRTDLTGTVVGTNPLFPTSQVGVTIFL